MSNFLAMSNIEAGSFTAVMGLLVVFFGITVIVLVISLIGMIMKRANNKAKKPAETKAAPAAPQPTVTADTANEEEEARVRAAIVAVLTAYYFNQGSNCEFRIKKIKRI